MKKRKLLFKTVIECPNSHETISEVYEDNGFYYYECGTCRMIVGLDSPEKRGDNSFTGPNCREIMKLFKVRDSQKNTKARKVK